MHEAQSETVSRWFTIEINCNDFNRRSTYLL